MTRVLAAIVAVFVAVCMAPGAARADEIRVMTSGAFTAPYLELAVVYERATGHRVVTEAISMGTGTTSIEARLDRGEAIDVVIVAADALDQLIAKGRVVPGTRVDLVRSAIGMAVRHGTPKPDISSVEALSRTLLAAESIAYSASVSGTYLSTELFQRLGIADRVLPKSRRIEGERVGAVVARGEAELGFQQISELIPIAGIELVGPLPPDVQRVTTFSAGIGGAARNAPLAKAFIDFLASPASAGAIRRSGLEPVELATAGYAHPEQLVDTAWLAAHAGDPDVRVLDLRRSGFEAGHIPGALWLDPESIRDPGHAPSFMLAPVPFAQVMGRLGISNRTRVIAYDDRGGLLAARLWWMLHAYGHANVALLDGGWVQWTAEQRATTTAVAPVQPAVFSATLQPRWLATAAEVVTEIGRSGTRILDARTVAEMDGSDTRLSSRGGVIPSAQPLYWEDLLDPVRKTFRPADQLRALVEPLGITQADEVIAYCWVGHRSAVDLFALRLIGFERVRNYLGSWEEWSRRTDLPTAPFRR